MRLDHRQVKTGPGGAHITIAGEAIPARWLRDHGEDDASRHPDSLQRRTDTFAIDQSIQITACHSDGDRLRIDWSDGAATEHSVDGLTRVVRDRRAPAPASDRPLRLPDDITLWSRPPEPTLFTVGVARGDLDGWIDGEGVGAALQGVRVPARIVLAVVAQPPGGNGFARDGDVGTAGTRLDLAMIETHQSRSSIHSSIA